MDKLLIRLTIVYTVLYFLSLYICAWFGYELYSDWYIILLELCVCSVMCSQGKYHCKYMKFTAFGITASDSVTRIDNTLQLLPLTASIIIPIAFMVCGIFVSFFFALRHYYRVKKLKR